MKKFLFFLALLFMASTAMAQDHLVRRKPNTSQQTTTKPVTKPNTRSSTKPSTKPNSKPKTTSVQRSKPIGASLCPDGNHPHFIDLGLASGTKWACCNVGATKPEEAGGYYAWGETEEKSNYEWSTYIHCDGTAKSCHEIGINICGTTYDVAIVKYHKKWQMPSGDQCLELVNNCTCTWISVNGVKGSKLTGKNGKSIFLPAAGFRKGSSFIDRGLGGSYWSGKGYHESYLSYDAFRFSISEGGGAITNLDDRYQGMTVRPVAK